MRILIVDDEELARQRLAQLIEELGPPYELAGEAADGQAALVFCAEQEVDLVLMDIRMPRMDGLEAARALSGGEQPPAIVFTTAYGEYALPAFDSHAVAYLLKPVRKERLRAALEKASVRTRAQLEGAQTGSGQCLSASYRGGVQRIPLSDVYYLRADNKYVVIRHEGGEALLEESLKSLEARLPGRFLRIHRNALVALNRLRGLEKDGMGRFCVTFQDLDERLEVSRRHLAALRQRLKA